MQRSRLKVGVDVPWVTSWSEEEVLGIAPCATVDGMLAIRQRQRPGFGRPQYSLNHHERQRASIRGLLCPMCGAPTPEGDRWTLTAKLISAGAIRAKGLGFTVPPELEDDQIVLNAGAISPGHRACLERSLEHCPHLGGDPTVEFLPFPDRWYTSRLEIEAAPEPAAHVLAQPRALAPVRAVGFLQLCGITGRREPRRGALPAARAPRRFRSKN